MHFVQCLSVFLTIQYGRIQLTAMESYPFFIIFGAKKPVGYKSVRHYGFYGSWTINFH